MDLVKVMETFPTQADCIAYLERLRWQGSPECPQCESTHVRRRTESATGRIGRYNCHDCRSTFKATHGTLFHGTKIPLQKWFLAISLMANAKKSLSSCQLARDLGVKQKACWRIMIAIRKGSTIAEFIKKFVKTEDAELYTDQYTGYNQIGKEMKHETPGPFSFR